MPLYEFICNTCDKQFETICSSSEIAAVICPACGSAQVKKLLSATSSVKSNDKAPLSSFPASPPCGRSGFS